MLAVRKKHYETATCHSFKKMNDNLDVVIYS